VPAVLLLNFNRPDLTAGLIDCLRPVQPPRVYFAVDGPRASLLLVWAKLAQTIFYSQGRGSLAHCVMATFFLSGLFSSVYGGIQPNLYFRDL
jgi:hypothetical protein